MNKTLYYIECTCIKDVKYPNVEIHIGEVLYYNPNVSSNEMYYYYNWKDKVLTPEEEVKKIRRSWCHEAHIPLTRKKHYAKKWQVKSAVERACIFIDKEHFSPVIKEIKLTYTVEE